MLCPSHRVRWVFFLSVLLSALSSVLLAEDARSAEADPDGGWPRSCQTTSGGALVMYQPQILTWEGQKHLVALAAVSFTPNGASKNALGTIKVESPTSVSLEERLVSFTRVEITEINFSSLSRDQLQEVTAEFQKTFPQENMVLGLDRVLACVDKSQIMAKGTEINTDPPTIFFSSRPAVLVQLDGRPILSPIKDLPLSFVVNTNWDLFQDTATKLYYLRHENHWLFTEDLAGAWQPVEKLPESFKKLPAADWKDVLENVPGKKLSKKDAPTVFLSEKPAELLLLKGEPKLEPVKGTALLWVSNTESDLFRLPEGDFFYLVAGRWFRASALSGPWMFATNNLPEDFQRIPPDHPRARVLSSVPGTDEAAEAILLAQVPQTARVNKKELKPPEVKYEGEPEFKPIETTEVSYAVNTPNDVVKYGDLYYLCFQGVWFMSTTPNGPWEVTTSIPKAVYEIPSTSPVYHVTYVYVDDPDPVYPVYGYTSGYMGVTISYGCVMWGTGWYYPPYYYYPPYGPPVYYPYRPTYGCGAVYNPWTGAYGWAQTAYGPYGGVSRAATYNPYTGTYARGGVAWGPYGAQGAAQAWNPRTGTYGQTRQGSNMYGSWGSSYVQRGDDWVHTQHVTDSSGTQWRAQGSEGGSAAGWHGEEGSGFVAEKNGDVYAGKDGNVYRKTEDGWQSWDNGEWSSPSRPEGQPKTMESSSPSTREGQPSTSQKQPSTGQAQPSTRPSQPSTGQTQPRDTTSQLDREAAARSRGASQSQNYGNYQRQSGSRSSPPSGGRRH